MKEDGHKLAEVVCAISQEQVVGQRTEPRHKFQHLRDDREGATPFHCRSFDLTTHVSNREQGLDTVDTKYLLPRTFRQTRDQRWQLELL